MRNNKIHKEIGKLIRQERTKQGISLRALAENTKLNTLTIAKIEKGTPATINSIIAVCKRLNISIVFSAAATEPVKI